MTPSALAALQPFLDQAATIVLVAVAVFVRISAFIFFLPGIGERSTPMQIKLGAALAFAIVTWPLVSERVTSIEAAPLTLLFTYGAEAICGLALGFGVRVLVFALQTAGTLAAQNLSLSQMFGSGVGPEPEPTIATILTMGGITLAMILGLHVKAAALIVMSYDVLPFATFPVAGDLAEWSMSRAVSAFNLAVSLALPFIIVAFLYNLALGFINRAMPQLMVAFVGVPAITGLGLILLMLLAGTTLTVWMLKLQPVLLDPFGRF
ncbi:MAG: flagellar biosynthetic protein FliR [Neomegalonema sp.]|nr:flagellar biosynthetic protein FliR [Neomegalonema sp.]